MVIAFRALTLAAALALGACGGGSSSGGTTPPDGPIFGDQQSGGGSDAGAEPGTATDGNATAGGTDTGTTDGDGTDGADGDTDTGTTAGDGSDTGTTTGDGSDTGTTTGDGSDTGTTTGDGSDTGTTTGDGSDTGTSTGDGSDTGTSTGDGSDTGTSTGDGSDTGTSTGDGSDTGTTTGDGSDTGTTTGDGSDTGTTTGGDAVLVPAFPDGSGAARLFVGLRRVLGVTLLELNARIGAGIGLTAQQETCLGAYEEGLGEPLFEIDCEEPLATESAEEVLVAQGAFYPTDACVASLAAGSADDCVVASADVHVRTQFDLAPGERVPKPRPGTGVEIRYAIDALSLSVASAATRPVIPPFRCDTDIRTGNPGTSTVEDCGATLRTVADALEVLLGDP